MSARPVALFVLVVLVALAVPVGAPVGAPVVGPRVAGATAAAGAVGGMGGVAAEVTVPVGVWPLDPVPPVARRFEPPPTPYAAGHRGADLLGSVGRPVRAALPGTIRFAGTLAGRGVVVVDHGATRTTYEPVGAGVAVGEVVTAGATIGTLQGPQSHCAPRACLHWGWRAGETYLDPLLLVGAGPVRLLPWAAGSPAAPGVGPAPRRPGVPGEPGVPAGWGMLVPALAVAQARGWAWR